MKENQIQALIVKYLRAVLPKNYRCFAVPNGSQRMPSGKPANAVPGLTPGIPDLAIVGDGRIFFIEVKAAKGRLSEAQSEFGDFCMYQAMVPWACVHSVDETRLALNEWGIKTKESV